MTNPKLRTRRSHDISTILLLRVARAVPSADFSWLGLPGGRCRKIHENRATLLHYSHWCNAGCGLVYFSAVRSQRGMEYHSDLQRRSKLPDHDCVGVSQSKTPADRQSKCLDVSAWAKRFTARDE